MEHQDERNGSGWAGNVWAFVWRDVSTVKCMGAIPAIVEKQARVFLHSQHPLPLSPPPKGKLRWRLNRSHFMSWLAVVSSQRRLRFGLLLGISPDRCHFCRFHGGHDQIIRDDGGRSVCVCCAWGRVPAALTPARWAQHAQGSG